MLIEVLAFAGTLAFGHRFRFAPSGLQSFRWPFPSSVLRPPAAL